MGSDLPARVLYATTWQGAYNAHLGPAVVDLQTLLDVVAVGTDPCPVRRDSTEKTSNLVERTEARS